MSDSGYGHEDISCIGIHVGILLECVCVFFLFTIIACALRWGVILVGDYYHWALLTPSWNPPFQVHKKTALPRGREYEEGRVVALRNIL